MIDLHIILDIDQTMVDSMSKFNYQKMKDKIRPPDFVENDICIWMRPDLPEFLDFLKGNVKYISIWTNGSSGWLFHIVRNIISKFIPINRIHLLLSIEHSTPMIIDNNQVYIKEIEKILKKFKRNDINLGNTILIDDNYLNCLYNKYNSLPIKKFLIAKESEIKRKDLDFTKKLIILIKKTNNVSNTLQNVYDGLTDYDKLFSSPQ